MPNINRVRLEICETEYIVTSEEPESYMLELGAQLDRDMRTLMNNDSRISTTMAAVLAALKATDAADNLRAQMKEYLDDNARARQDADNARREADRLRREIQDMQDKFSSQRG